MDIYKMCDLRVNSHPLYQLSYLGFENYLYGTLKGNRTPIARMKI